MSKLISFTDTEIKVKDITKKDEFLSLLVHAALMIALCLMFPVLSKVYVEPLLVGMFGTAMSVLPSSVLMLLVVIICFIFAVPFMAYRYSSHIHGTKKLSYMNGINMGNNKEFVDAFGEPKHLFMSNWYFKWFFGQRKLMVPCELISAVFLIGVLCIILGGAL